MELKLAMPGGAVHEFRRQMDFKKQYYGGSEPYEVEYPSVINTEEEDLTEGHFQHRYLCKVVLPDTLLDQVLSVYEIALSHNASRLAARRYEAGQRDTFRQKTDLEQFVDQCANLQTWDFHAAAQRNAMILYDLKERLPVAMDQLKAIIEAVQLAEPFEGAVKPYKTKDGETFLFTFERKAIYKGKKILVGRLAEIQHASQEENRPRIGIGYAWLVKLDWQEGVTYAITNTGMRDGKRSRDPEYWSFDVKVADKLINEL